MVIITTVLPNMERAAQLLSDLQDLRSHQGVTNKQREGLLQEVFARISIDGKTIVEIEPRPAYIPLFAAMMVQDFIGYQEFDPTPSLDTQEFLLGSGVAVTGIKSWVERFAKTFQKPCGTKKPALGVSGKSVASSSPFSCPAVAKGLHVAVPTKTSILQG